jgi:CYTH domain-containing protein
MSQTSPDLPLWEIVLAGNKNESALAYLEQKLTDRGYTVLVPQAAPRPDDDNINTSEWTQYWLMMQRSIRQCWRVLGESLAKKGPTIVLYVSSEIDIIDELDARADMELAQAGFGLREARDTYDLPILFHRGDAPQTQWAGHPHLKVILLDADDYTMAFDLALKHVGNLIEEPVYEYERKYLVDLGILDQDRLTGVNHINIRQDYLYSDGQIERRIRKRSQGNHHTYYYTEKQWSTNDDGSREEKDVIITAAQYGQLAVQREEGRETIVKDRYCLVWRNHYIEIDIFHSPQNLGLVEVETSSMRDKVVLPKWLEESVVQEVTGNPVYHNYNIARGK